MGRAPRARRVQTVSGVFRTFRPDMSGHPDIRTSRTPGHLGPDTPDTPDTPDIPDIWRRGAPRGSGHPGHPGNRTPDSISRTIRTFSGVRTSPDTRIPAKVRPDTPGQAGQTGMGDFNRGSARAFELIPPSGGTPGAQLHFKRAKWRLVPSHCYSRARALGFSVPGGSLSAQLTCSRATSLGGPAGGPEDEP